jgi:hypothetical protein
VAPGKPGRGVEVWVWGGGRKRSSVEGTATAGQEPGEERDIYRPWSDGMCSRSAEVSRVTGRHGVDRFMGTCAVLGHTPHIHRLLAPLPSHKHPVPPRLHIQIPLPVIPL